MLEKQYPLTKAVLFQRLEKPRWNLCFGDLRGGEIQDSAITNNNDVLAVISTVAAAVREFMAANPESIIVIKPVDEKRKRLYNLVFQRRFSEISALIEIFGFTEREIWEPYSPQTEYEKFEIALKFGA